MGFSVEQDADVQAYEQLRATVLAQERLRRDAARGARGRELKRFKLSLKGDGKRGASVGGGGGGGVLRRLGSLCGRGLGWRNAVSVGGVIVAAKKLEEDSDFEGEGEEGLLGFEEVDIKVALKE